MSWPTIPGCSFGRFSSAIGMSWRSAMSTCQRKPADFRFFTAPSRLSDADLEYLTNLDYHDHFAWAAFAIDERGQPGIGVARYIRDPAHSNHAEVAVTVLDDYQHRGLGTLLLVMLAVHARRNGITTFVSHILWDNRELLETLAAAGARIEPEEPGVARVAIEIPPPESPTLVGLVWGRPTGFRASNTGGPGGRGRAERRGRRAAARIARLPTLNVASKPCGNYPLRSRCPPHPHPLRLDSCY